MSLLAGDCSTTAFGFWFGIKFWFGTAFWFGKWNADKTCLVQAESLNELALQCFLVAVVSKEPDNHLVWNCCCYSTCLQNWQYTLLKHLVPFHLNILLPCLEHDVCEEKVWPTPTVYGTVTHGALPKKTRRTPFGKVCLITLYTVHMIVPTSVYLRAHLKSRRFVSELLRGGKVPLQSRQIVGAFSLFKGKLLPIFGTQIRNRTSIIGPRSVQSTSWTWERHNQRAWG